MILIFIEAYDGNVLSAIITNGIKIQPIPPIPSMILSMPKQKVDDTNGAITPDVDTNKTARKNADRLPQ